MPEYHIGMGILGCAIYAGTLEPKNKRLWRNKTDCTEEAIDAVRDYMVEQCLGGFDCKKSKYNRCLCTGKCELYNIFTSQDMKEKENGQKFAESFLMLCKETNREKWFWDKMYEIKGKVNKDGKFRVEGNDEFE